MKKLKLHNPLGTIPVFRYSRSMNVHYWEGLDDEQKLQMEKIAVFKDPFWAMRLLFEKTSILDKDFINNPSFRILMDMVDRKVNMKD
jgi:hypothetical protein